MTRPRKTESAASPTFDPDVDFRPGVALSVLSDNVELGDDEASVEAYEAQVEAWLDLSDEDMRAEIERRGLWEAYLNAHRALDAANAQHRRPARAVFNRKSQPIVDAIKAVFEKYEPPLTVRQVYYQLASAGLVPLSQAGYNQAQRLQLKLRELGEVEWGWYADRVRERIRVSQWEDTAAFADTISHVYRKDLWQAQPEHVEFWLEKDALAGFVSEALKKWGNPLCVVRGFSSATFVFECAAILREIDKPKHIYFLGDHDPSGLSIEESVRSRLDQFGAEFTFQRLAIDLEDIKTYDLRPLTAKPSDSRYEKYVAKHGPATVEIDALPPDVLRERIQSAVSRHIDIDAWRRLARVEAIEQESIRNIADRMRGLA